jgi:Flp pilus assembly protein TadG
MLVPAGFLILLLLGGLSVDSAVAFLGQRQLTDATAGAANDAATEALSDAAFYGSGATTIDMQSAVRVVCADLAVSDSDVRGVRVAIGVSGATVVVRATGEVRAVFGRNVPGFAERPVSAQSRAVATSGPLSYGQGREDVPLTPVTC